MGGRRPRNFRVLLPGFHLRWNIFEEYLVESSASSSENLPKLTKFKKIRYPMNQL
ncbi:Hypothetical protein [Corynebacterium glutamicum ATCC 13032]|uniref:Uncharacterized protein n=1 Tax=Corynebacterium glutamicum (strain ATCC 13032 / DSM 20300 / JCM 1318 / BCRC 11384 / CCUG 27702 / LMG 3730 / NBRC 12168 / NCIMB 10025 / NRRL B-2784 / 534) TaxID=196627 RepID=Q8NTJ4_CORGL|nr:Hypothetical protein [Corynebacterium glutamicum ATCC 13032]